MIVMTGHIVDDAVIRHRPGYHRVLHAAGQAEHHLSGCVFADDSADITPVLRIEHTALQAVPDRVVEYRNRADGAFGGCDLFDVGLACPPVFHQRRCSAGPAFAVKDRPGIDGVHLGLDLLHGLYIMKRHQIKAEAVHMIFLRPVADRIHHVLPEHRAFRSGFIAAPGAVGPAAAVVKPIVVIRNNPVQAGISVIGMVIDHIHDHTQPASMQRLHHLLEFRNTDLAVEWIRGIASFRHVIVLRVVSPVKLRLIGGLVHRGIIVYRLQVHMGDSQIRQVVNAGRFSGSIFQSMFGKGQVFAGISRRGQLVGEVTDMYFPDHRFIVGTDAVNECVLPKSFRICGIQVNHHAPVTIHADRPGIGIHRFLFPDNRRHRIGIVGARAAGCFRAPHALISQVHVNAVIRFPAVSGLKQIQHHPGSRRRPDLEGCAVFPSHSAQVIPVIVIFLRKGCRIKNIGGYRGDRVIPFNLHRIGAGQVQLLPDGNLAGNHAVVQA